MRFRVDRDVLAEAVTWTARSLPTRPPVPVLAGVRIDVDDTGVVQLSSFDYEVSAIGVRGQDGRFAMYPLNRNLHQDGILRLTRAPWKAPRLEAWQTAIG